MKKQFGKNQNYSLIKKLRKEKKSTKEFEVMLNSLSLEEVIGLKLELAAKLFGNKLFGIPIWYSLKTITQDAILKFALSATKSKKEAARFLGISPQELRELIKKYNIENFFENSLDT